MLGSYRGIFAALAGLAALFIAFGSGAYLTGLNYPEQERYQTYRYAPGDPEAAKAALFDKSKPVDYREPCKQPEGRDESDLCAQWKAARAAEDSALWAARGFWVGFLGVVGLFVTLYYTRKAVRAAEDATVDTGRAIEIAERTATAAAEASKAMRDANTLAFNMGAARVKAWLSISEPHLEGPTTAGDIKVRFRIRNNGATQAKNCHLTWWIIAQNFPLVHHFGLRTLGDLPVGAQTAETVAIQLPDLVKLPGFYAHAVAARIIPVIGYRDVFGRWNFDSAEFLFTITGILKEEWGVRIEPMMGQPYPLNEQGQPYVPGFGGPGPLNGQPANDGTGNA